MDHSELITKFKAGDIRSLSRMISVVEDSVPGWEDLLMQLDLSAETMIVGITGPPGAGKSTLINALIDTLGKDLRIAVLAVDPSSPFNSGSVLGDRLRMAEHFNDSNVFIRSLATRGALGGLSNKIFEVLSVLRAARFDFIIIETVGVGQSEVEVASMADTTVVVFVPESGDEVQALKSGIMEVADIIVVNKADREGAGKMVNSINSSLHHRKVVEWQVPVIQTVATQKTGIDLLYDNIKKHRSSRSDADKLMLLKHQANRILINRCMEKIDQVKLSQLISAEAALPGFNIYKCLRKLTV